MSTPLLDSRPALNHPVHIILLVSSLPLCLGALLADWAYSASYQIQWINFASWLIAGALVFLGFALLWTIIQALRADAPSGRGKWIFVVLVAATFGIGFVNALVHAKDAWATMPAGMVLSIFFLILSVVSLWFGFAKRPMGEPK